MSASGEKAGAAGATSQWQWFHKNIGRVETEKLLVENREDGSFLIRESDTVKGAYVLSTIFQQRIHHYRILPNAEGGLSIQAQEGVTKRLFHSLENLVEHYSHRGRGLVCPLIRPIAQAKEDEELPEEQDSDDDHEPDGDHREEKIVSKFLLASLSTLSITGADDGFTERLKAYITGDITADIQSMVSPAPQLTNLKLLLASDCEELHRQLDQLMGRVDILQSLFERAGGAKEVGRRSSVSKRRRSRVGETDFDTLGIKLRECSDSVQSLETTSFQMLRELSAGITGQVRPAGSLGQVATPTAALTNGEQENEEEMVFETKTDGLSGKKSYTIAINLKEGKLSFKKQGESHSMSFSHQQVLQLVKSRSKEQRLGILMEGQNRKDHNFVSMQAREHFCQLIQLIRNRMKAGEGVEQDSVSIFVGTWNMGDQSPPGDISSWFRSVGQGKTLPRQLASAHDIYAIGTQECSISEKEWVSKIRSTLKVLHDIDYEKVASQTLWGIRLVILIKPEHTNKITHVQGSQVRTGIGNALGNKGGVGISFFYGSVSMCFINCHLTSGNEKCHRRNQNYHDIVKGMGALKHRRLNQFHLTNQFHHLFFFGDLNYRVDLGATEIVEFAKRDDHIAIFKEDQLKKEKDRKKVFVGFDEAPILFPPTYRFARGRRSLDDYVWVKQKRSGIRLNVPSYCDRVLWCSYPGTLITNSSYGACTDIMTSDHSPLFASFQVGGVRQYAPEPGRGLGGEKKTFIIVDSLKAKIQTSSKTAFYMEVYSHCFEGAQRSVVNDEWIDTQAGYVWPVWCGRDHVVEVEPIVTELEYLEQQHLLILLKSQEGDESYAECCLSLRGFFSPKPVNVKKTLIHQGLEVGELDAYLHVTLNQYRRPEEELYSDLNFITADNDSSDLDSGRNRGRLGTGHSSTNSSTGLPRAGSLSERPMLPAPRSATHTSHHPSSSSSSSSSSSASSSSRAHSHSTHAFPSHLDRIASAGSLHSTGPPPLPKRRDTTQRPPLPTLFSKHEEHHRSSTPVRRSESIAVPQKHDSVPLGQHTSSSLDESQHTRPRGSGSHPPFPTSHQPTPSSHLPFSAVHHPNPASQQPVMSSHPPVPVKRKGSFPKTSRDAFSGPHVPPRNSSRDQLLVDHPPPLPPKSPEPPLQSHGKPSETHRKLSSVGDLLTLHGLTQYSEILISNGYDDIRFISDISDDELKEIGVVSVSERQRLLKIFSAYAS